VIYLAYTREDALFAVQIAEELAGMGIDIWLDINEIGPEADWPAAQQAAIVASEGLIAVISPEALDREHMRREVQQALANRKPVHIAVARRSPWQDWLSGLPIADFTQDYDQGLNDLVIGLLNGGDSAPAKPQPTPSRAKSSDRAPNRDRDPAPAREKEQSRSLFRRLRRR
jgi:hypothetical protein